MYYPSIVLSLMLLYTLPLWSIEGQGYDVASLTAPVTVNEELPTRPSLSHSAMPVSEIGQIQTEDIQGIQEETEKEQAQEQSVEETDNLEELLTLVETVEIPVPEPKPLPRFITALIPYALSVVYACNDLKEWLASKLF